MSRGPAGRPGLGWPRNLIRSRRGRELSALVRNTGDVRMETVCPSSLRLRRAEVRTPSGAGDRALVGDRAGGTGRKYGVAAPRCRVEEFPRLET